MAASIQEFDLIQRIRVENGVPRVISTTIQVIEGGEDLMSFAITSLKQRGFYEKYTENLKSQYVGYKLKTPKKGARRYQLILSSREETLLIAIPKTILDSALTTVVAVEPNNLTLMEEGDLNSLWEPPIHSLWWVIPSYEEDFLRIINNFGGREDFQEGFKDCYVIPSTIDEIDFFCIAVVDTECAIMPSESSLFPYAREIWIDSKEILELFFDCYIPRLMEL